MTVADVVKLTSAEAVSGDLIAITPQGGTVKVNDASVIEVDVRASNGVIHVTDTVILPKE